MKQTSTAIAVKAAPIGMACWLVCAAALGQEISTKEPTQDQNIARGKGYLRGLVSLVNREIPQPRDLADKEHKRGTDEWLAYYNGVVTATTSFKFMRLDAKALVDAYNATIAPQFKENQRPDPRAIQAWGQKTSELLRQAGMDLHPLIVEFFKDAVTWVLIGKHGFSLEDAGTSVPAFSAGLASAFR